MTHRILLVDDEPNVLAALERALLDEPWEIHTASSGEAGLEAMAKQAFTVIVSDERMPGMGGAEFLSQARTMYPETLRILLTGQASLESTMKAVNGGEIYRFFLKPWDETSVILALRSAVEKSELEEENRQLLRTVKRQSSELKMLEKSFPGITELRKDDSGAYVLEEISDDEVADLIAKYGG
ncbi:MAG: response regulator [Myxococcales bacterium]|nr:response regulator [Myxococcales bacterium]